MFCCSCRLTRADQARDHGFERQASSAILAAALEIDPAFVEAVDHADARHGMLHALRSEELFPAITGDRLHPHLAAEGRRESPADIGTRPWRGRRAYPVGPP